MEIDSLKVKNFRNYGDFLLKLDSGVNIIYGKNGLGKTNLLEAMFLCAVGKSFRGAKDSELIKRDCDGYFVYLKINNDLTSDISILSNKKREKYIKINGLYIKKMKDLMGAFNAVVFAPEDLLLVSGSPSQRRRFLDMALCQLGSLYYHNLILYNKTVEQKNVLLKSKNIDPIMLSTYNEQLAEYGTEIIYSRLNLIKNLNTFSGDIHGFITEKKENLEIEYDCFIKGISAETEKKEIYNKFCNILLTNTEKEKEKYCSLYGPHKDDFSFTLNGENLKSFGSQGQKRTAVIALKIAELKNMERATGRRPVLFLDDVLSELDNKRQKKLLSYLNETQTVITCTEIDFSTEGLKANIIDLESLNK